MIGDFIGVIIMAAILAIPVCASFILVRRINSRSEWPSKPKRFFWITFSRLLLILAVVVTILEVMAAAQHPSGTQWGRATASLFLTYFLLLIPLSAFLALVSAALYRAFGADGKAQPASDGNAEKPPGAEREP